MPSIPPRDVFRQFTRNLLSVDINGAARSDTTAPGFAKWDMTR